MHGKKSERESDRAKRIIRKNNGIIRSSQIRELGIHPRALYNLRDAGELLEISRGIFCLPDYEFADHMDLEIVAMRVPKAVVCLESALSFHELTTHIPHAVSIAIPKSIKNPTIDFPPIEVYHFSGASYEDGIEYHTSDHTKIAVYGREKTIADCFKFRNSIGMDIIIEALKTYRQQQRPEFSHLNRYARICRVEKVMRPYLEMIQ